MMEKYIAHFSEIKSLLYLIAFFLAPSDGGWIILKGYLGFAVVWCFSGAVYYEHKYPFKIKDSSMFEATGFPPKRGNDKG